jgi:hypothetical protein
MRRGLHVLVFVVVCGGCGGAPPPQPTPAPKPDPIAKTAAPTCKQVGDHLATLAEHDAMQDDAKTAKPLGARCATDGWSDDARDCFATAQAPAELDGCRALLTPSQRDALAKATSKTLPVGAGDPWNPK